MNCKICGSKTEIWQVKELSYDYCSNCKFISKDEKQLVSEKEELIRYNSHNNNIENKDYRAYLKIYIDKAITPFISSGKVLDFGSGPEPVLADVLKKDYKFNVDIYDYFFSPKKTYCNKKYDLIICSEVIEHLKRPLEYFSLFDKLLNNGGYLSISTLFHNNNLEDFSNWHYQRDITHISFFNQQTFDYIADKFKFEILFNDNNRHLTVRKKI